MTAGNADPPCGDSARCLLHRAHRSLPLVLDLLDDVALTAHLIPTVQVPELRVHIRNPSNGILNAVSPLEAEPSVPEDLQRVRIPVCPPPDAVVVRLLEHA